MAGPHQVPTHTVPALPRAQMASPDRMAETGRIRCPTNLPPSSKAAMRNEARVGSTTCGFRLGLSPGADLWPCIYKPQPTTATRPALKSGPSHKLTQRLTTCHHRPEPPVAPHHQSLATWMTSSSHQSRASRTGAETP